MSDLDDEFLTALHRVGWDDAAPAGRWLGARGLDARRRWHVGGIGVARATLFPTPGSWEPNDEGERVLMVGVWDGSVSLVIDHGGDADSDTPSLIDLVCWQPASPTKLYRRTGEAALVGIGGLDAAVDHRLPLRLHANVESFIRAGGELGQAAEPFRLSAHGAVKPLRPAAVVLDCAFRRSRALKPIDGGQLFRRIAGSCLAAEGA